MTLKKYIAIGCAAVTLALAVFVYFGEYAYSGNENSLASGIEAFTLEEWKEDFILDLSDLTDGSGFSVTITEIKKDGGYLTASFTLPDDADFSGTAVFKKGLNFRYRIKSVNYDDRGAIGKAELFMLEVGCLLILALGLIFTRYFWSSK